MKRTYEGIAYHSGRNIVFDCEYRNGESYLREIDITDFGFKTEHGTKMTIVIEEGENVLRGKYI
jgi:hypothetical protein